MQTHHLRAMALIGLSCQAITVEADTGSGLHGITIVGLPDASVQEAKERVRAALRNSGLELPRSLCVVNLAPADVRKEGAGYDLPIALAVLLASGQLDTEQLPVPTMVMGELGLDGSLRPISGVITMALHAAASGITRCIVPAGNADEAAYAGTLEVYAARNLREVVDHLRGEQVLTPHQPQRQWRAEHPPVAVDLADIRGQAAAKRALEIAASGGHNLLLAGPPGSGKTMLAKALIGLLPDLTFAEALEITQLYSVSGLLDEDHPILTSRPLRAPHHTSSTASLIGGGRIPRPGEISLAHRGVLFLDELPEYPRIVLEAMRQPLEEGVVHVARVHGSVQYPARFIFIAAHNPCPCGYVGDPERSCSCSQLQIQSYRKRLSGPILDRIDLFVNAPRLPIHELQDMPVGETSDTVRTRVQAARETQTKRFIGEPIMTNAEIPARHIDTWIPIDATSKKMLVTAAEKLHLSARAYHRILKVSRTIADLAGSPDVTAQHVAEALQYRQRGE